MRSTGSRTLFAKAVAAPRTVTRKRVLFVCIGNMCRSPMAEFFARCYGSDVLEAASAGLMPGPVSDSRITKVMAEKGIALGDHFPKGLDELEAAEWDLAVNMSGLLMPKLGRAEIREWAVRDPYQMAEPVYREVRDEIEQRVMSLILELRRQR